MVDQEPPAFIAKSAKPKKSEGELDPTTVKGLREAGDMVVRLDADIVLLERDLTQLKEKRNTLVSKTIPDLFDQAGTDNIGLPSSGQDLVMSPYYKANISVDWEEKRRDAAYEWLDENGYGSVIKATVELSFSKEDFQAAKDFVAHVKHLQKEFEEGRSNMGPIPEPIMQMSVKWNTLTALVKELSERGVSLPLETLGATVGRVAKLVKRKK